MTIVTPDRDIDLANVTIPAGATRVTEWSSLAGENPWRYYRGTRRDISMDGHETTVDVDGSQEADGSMSRNINITEDGGERLMELTSDRARAIGLALIAAADEADEWKQVGEQ